MSARKLSRLAGFAFVLAAVFGGIGAASASAASAAPEPTVTVLSTQGEVIWT
ncbi:hypothetical protein AB0M54_25630 [Actinoplanes sp. NPDC051470]|uniref:hypothetical protein n=1 Tax=unclassified Actinoplanes TaxID=2626549 RepID=UPI003419EFE5